MTADPATTFEAATDTAVRLAAGHAINVLRQRLEDAALDENPRRSPAINAGAGLDDDKPTRDPGEPDQPNRADPTGEEALRSSRARADEKRMRRLVSQYDRIVEDIVQLCEAWTPPSKTALDDLRELADDTLNPNQCAAHAAALGVCFDLTPAELERRKRHKAKLCRTCFDKLLAIQTEPKLQPCSDDKALGILVRLLRITEGVPTTRDLERAAGLKPNTIRAPRDVVRQWAS